MDKENNPNYVSFFNSFKKIIGQVEFEASELVYLTDDNSFPDFLVEFCRAVGKDIECGILEEEYLPKDPGAVENNFNRYIYSVGENVRLKAVNDRLASVIIDVNILLNNWLRMVEESDLYNNFCFDKSKAQALSNQIADIDDIVNGTINLEKLIWITSNLIDKAKQVLASVPPSFNISQHYHDAVQKALED